MNRFGSSFKPRVWFTTILLAALVAGCGGGGGGGIGGVAPGATVVPGAPGTAGAGATDPTVGSANPGHLATNVPTSTSSPAVTGTLVTATFTQTMDPLTVVSPALTFTLKQTVAGTNVPGTVTMNAARTVATFTPTAAALIANTSYTATVTTAAKNSLGTAMASPVAWRFTTAAVASTGQSSPNLGTAASYGVFASAAAVTLAANSSVRGDVGLNPVGACNGCTIGVTVIGGVIHNGDAPAIQAQTDFNTAYVDAANRATNACPIVNSDLSSAQAACNGVTPGPTYKPGLYRTATAIGLSGTMTLDAGGNPDAVFIFQTDTAITTASNSVVVLANGAQAKNVWWMAGSAATLGVSSTFKGTVIANGAAVTVLGGTALAPTQVVGRLFSHSAAADVNAFATVTVPQ